MSHLYQPGEPAAFYINFERPNGQAIDPESGTSTISIWLIHGNEEKELLIDNQPLTRLDTGYYYYLWDIPLDACTGQYGVLYRGSIDGIIGQSAETFTIANITQTNGKHIGTAMVHGVVSDNADNPIGHVRVRAKNTTSNHIYITSSEDDGTWELFLLPGYYVVRFEKSGFGVYENQIQVPNIDGEVPFESIIV